MCTILYEPMFSHPDVQFDDREAQRGNEICIIFLILLYNSLYLQPKQLRPR